MITIPKIKRYFLNRQFQKQILENEESRVVFQNEIKTVGIIYSEEISKWLDNKDEVEKTLNLRNPKLYSFRKFSKKNDISFKHFSEKDFNWKGQANQPNFKSFVDQPFDLLIGYFNKKNLYLENAVLQSNAKFKVGFSKVNQSLYDIEITDYPNNIHSFLNELKKYLIILKKLKT